MDATALYYALSTIAQCAAALAALIGFLGLWRLDRLRDEEQHIESRLRELMSRTGRLRQSVIPIPSERPDLNRIPQWELYPAVDAVIANPSPGTEQEIKPEIETKRQRGRAIPREQQRFMGVLQRFLRRTLVILALAIIGLVFANALNAWVVTRWLSGLLIIVAGILLWRDTYSVVREAARFPSTLLIVAVGLLLASPTMAATRCLTYQEQTLNRLHTLCDDGSRGISTWNRTLERWETTVTPPAKTCTGQLNPRTQQWERRCR